MNRTKIEDVRRTSLLIEKFFGENNRNNPWEMEVGELYSSNNVDVTLKNKLQSRVGQTLVNAGVYKSLHGFGDYGYAVKNEYLVYIDAALAVTNLKRIGGNDCSMVEYASRVFYTNTQIIEYAKGKDTYALPAPTDQYRSKPPPGQLLAVLGNRMYIAVGPYIYFTDVGKFNSVDMRQNIRRLNGRVTMMLPVNDGMFISDVVRTYFAQGINPYKQTLREVYNYPAIEGQQTELNNRMVMDGVEGKVVGWMSRKGVCFGMDGGKTVNVTANRYDMPNAIRACLLYKNVGNVSQIVSVMY